jgi:hypothetical protein
MIAIVNVSTHNNPTGPHRYEVRINREVIARFAHNREDGLTRCLEKAAAAVAKARDREILVFIEEMARHG